MQTANNTVRLDSFVPSFEPHTPQVIEDADAPPHQHHGPGGPYLPSAFDCRPDIPIGATIVAVREPVRLPNRHLPPHLGEVCNLLARGLLRLRAREEVSSQVSDPVGECFLDFTAYQRGHAKPKLRRRT